MLRLRLASLALASGLLFLLSGCASSTTCEESRFFPRLFRSNSPYPESHGMPGECDCHQSQFPAGMDMSALPGPQFPQSAGPNQTVPIPITNVPSNQPPQVFKVPQALPTPYNPTH